jgi:hypothetical protein
VTISGRQDGTGPFFTLCLPRPDLLAGPLDLGDDSLVQVIEVGAEALDCTYSKTLTAVPTGTITFAGYCSAAGTVFDMTLAGAVAGSQVCQGVATDVSLALAGTISVLTP